MYGYNYYCTSSKANKEQLNRDFNSHRLLLKHTIIENWNCLIHLVNYYPWGENHLIYFVIINVSGALLLFLLLCIQSYNWQLIQDSAFPTPRAQMDSQANYILLNQLSIRHLVD